ncbi:MAG: sulfite exporter TauE/SafE family protein [Lyngbya sp. HA4199-MV5]|jgi:hypothetical protein|nr:sulfite exporter TauE/SafE family protein [Lyngbya sp. HA4199-MV5]
MINAQPLTLNAGLLFVTAFVAGGLNAVAGGGSFVTFPTLIFTGMSPIAANATNNTALWIAAMASAGAYRKDLKIPRRDLWILSITSLIGGALGALLLLSTDAGVFQRLIPYLLLFATLIFTFGDWFKARLPLQRDAAPPPLLKLVLAQFAIAIYGGFFGAGLGILMLATLAFLGIKNMHAMNAFKVLLGSCINGIAVIPFILAGVILWQQALLMAVAASLGGYLTAHYARQLDPQLIRNFVIVVAFTMTAYFFIHS